MVDTVDMKLFRKALHTDDFQGLNKKKLLRLVNLFLAEFFGTAIIVTLGCGTVVGKAFAPEIGYLAICLAFSCGVSTSVMLFSHISGSHVNPAVSVAAVICGEISIAMSILYIIAQCLGGTFGYFLVMLISKQDIFSPQDISGAGKACLNVVSDKYDIQRTLLTEAIAAAILVWSVCSVWDKRNQDKHDSASIKFAVVLLALAIPAAAYSSCSINPARSFGPVLLTGFWTNHWVFWLGPIAGAVVASVIYTVVFQPSRMAIAGATGSHSGNDSVPLKLRNSHKEEEA